MPLARALTPADVRALHAFMAAHFGATLVDKTDAAEMRLVEQFVDRFGITTAEFMRSSATTVATRIYLPYEPGDESTGWSLVWQCATIAHECTHVRQWLDDTVRFAADYGVNTESRAAYEVAAYRVSLTVEHAITGAMTDPRALAQHLHGYGCTAADVELAARMLEDSADTVLDGGLPDEASRVAVAWLEEHVR